MYVWHRDPDIPYSVLSTWILCVLSTNILYLSYTTITYFKTAQPRSHKQTDNLWWNMRTISDEIKIFPGARKQFESTKQIIWQPSHFHCNRHLSLQLVFINKSSDNDDVIKWKHFPRHRSPVNSPHKGQWRGALMFSLICVWKNGLVNTREAGDLIRYRAHYDVIVMRYVRK